MFQQLTEINNLKTVRSIVYKTLYLLNLPKVLFGAKFPAYLSKGRYFAEIIANIHFFLLQSKKNKLQNHLAFV